MAETIKQTIEYVAKTSAAERALRGLGTAEKNLIQEFRDGNRTYDQAKAGLKEVARGYDSAEQAADSYRNSLKALRKEQNFQSQVEANDTRFSTVSRNVAAAGDVQSNLGALSGLAGSAGLGGVSQGLGIAGELVVLTEELPRLKASLQGMPAAAQAAAQALGLSSSAGLIGALGITALAVGAVVVAFNAVQKSLEGVKSKAVAAVNAEIEFNRQLATLTSQQIDERLRAIQIERDAQQDSLNKLQDTINGFGPLKGFLGESATQAEELEQTITALDAEEAELNQNRNNAVIAANDAAAAEEKLAQARASAALQDAQYAAQSVALQQDAAKFTEEELQARRVQLQERKAQLEAELQSLQASGDTSEAVTQRIEQLGNELKQLGNDLNFLNSSTAKTKAANNSAKQATEKLEAATKKAAKTYQSAAQQTTAAVDKMSYEIKEKVKAGFALGGTSFARAGGGSGKSSAASSQAKSDYDDINKRRTDLFNDTNQALYQNALDLYNNLQGLKVNQKRAFEDSFASGNILGLRDLTRDIRRQREDYERDTELRKAEIQKEAQAKQLALFKEFQNEVLGIMGNIVQSAKNLRQQSSGFSYGGATTTRSG